MKLDLPNLIRIGGVLHFGLLLASFSTPIVMNWRTELRKLQPLNRHLIWVHGTFIVLTIIGLGVIAIVNAPELATGSALARSLCAFIAIFWAARLSLQYGVFDPGPLMANRWLKIGYHSLSVVFLYFAVTFGWAAVHP